MADIIETIKKAALGVIEESSPTSILFGTVISTVPLQIQVEQKLVLTEDLLVLTKNVIDYDVNVSIDWNTNSKVLSANHFHESNSEILIDSILKPNTNNQTIENTVNSNASVETAIIDLTHSHSISGVKTMKVYNSLKQNDKVILIQIQGGQKFVVLDKVY